MFRKEVRTILCPSCGRLTRADAPECLICGRRRPGLWGFTSLGRRLFRAGGTTRIITVACVALYVASIVFDPAAALAPQGPFEILAPGGRALRALGMTGSWAWQLGQWWTLFTAIYLHGGVLHILFNVLWIRQLGPAVEDVYGPARCFVIFTVAGVLGFVVSDVVGVPFTIGASGAIFGLFGALVAFGHRRGGTFGRLLVRQYGVFAIILFAYGLVPGSGVNNWAHAAGFIGGLATALAMPSADRYRETALDQFVAAALVAVTLAGFGLAVHAALA